MLTPIMVSLGNQNIIPALIKVDTVANNVNLLVKLSEVVSGHKAHSLREVVSEYVIP